MLTDTRPGNVNQVVGVAEALGWPFESRAIAYGPAARLPNWLLGASLVGLTTASRQELRPPWPAIAIGAGRRAAPVLRHLKRQHPPLLAVQLMWPGSARGLDLVAVPEHDHVLECPGLVRSLGNAHRLTAPRLARAAATLEPQLRTLPRPRIACLVGGRTRRRAFTPEDAGDLAEQASALATGHGGSLLVTTSRRTGVACERALADALYAPHLLSLWTADGGARYESFLGSADAVIVTAESTSMCVEACATGAPVFAFRPAAGISAKTERLHHRLGAAGHVRPLGAPWPAQPPAGFNAAATIAAVIRERAGPIGAPDATMVASSSASR